MLIARQPDVSRIGAVYPVYSGHSFTRPEVGSRVLLGILIDSELGDRRKVGGFELVEVSDASGAITNMTDIASNLPILRNFHVCSFPKDNEIKRFSNPYMLTAACSLSIATFSLSAFVLLFDLRSIRAAGGKPSVR